MPLALIRTADSLSLVYADDARQSMRSRFTDPIPIERFLTIACAAAIALGHAHAAGLIYRVGLAICRSIIEAHSGKLEAHPPPGGRHDLPVRPAAGGRGGMMLPPRHFDQSRAQRRPSAIP